MSITEEIAGLIRSLRKTKDAAELQKLCDRLEAQVAELQAQLAALGPRGERCKFCGYQAMFVTASEEDPVFRDLGGQQRTYTCRQCGKSETRIDVL